MIFKKITFVLLCFASSMIVKSQSADEIISKYIAYTGGVEKWENIKSVTSSGIYNYGGVEFPFKAYSKAPDLYEYVVTFKGKSFTQAYDGKSGWRIDGFKNEKKKTILTGKQATALANEADVELESPFINYQQKGHKVVLEGKDTVNNKACYKIKLTRKNGNAETYFFDSDNFSLTKKQAVSKNTELDNSMLDIFYSDYKPADGITVPYKISCLSNGQTMLVITVQDIKLDLPIEDTLFKP